MADVSIDYQTIASVAAILNNAVANIIPQLQALKSQVDGLLTQDGGLWLDKSSPALQASYKTFNDSLTQAVNGISNFAQQFTQIAGQLQNLDTNMANNINNPPPDIKNKVGASPTDQPTARNLNG
jgi:uncharacterized protein YukE